jgi:3D (Asp-Asp-Asp) domain-containing protein
MEEKFNLRAELRREIEQKYQREYHVRATAYTASVDETDSDPMHTALMTRPTPGRTVAVSRDLMHLLGADVYIYGLGVRKVEDLMNERFTNSIDIFMTDKEKAQNFGVQHVTLISPDALF